MRSNCRECEITGVTAFNWKGIAEKEILKHNRLSSIIYVMMLKGRKGVIMEIDK